MLLKVVNYFRDSYRATNYGVPDLFELIRQLARAIFLTQIATIQAKKIPDNILDRINLNPKTWHSKSIKEKVALLEDIDELGEEIENINTQFPRIKLNFLGHTMGCFVVTNTIRILSDVFDTNAIKKKPSPELGRVFSLGRLILVAPDIPVETIMTRRGNFLKSSLLRCEEAYVFSNEGDVVLRVLSTAANYFSFPTKTRFGGYRLGNITAKHFDDQSHRRNQQVNKYGIVNRISSKEILSPSDHLEVRASSQEHTNLHQLHGEQPKNGKKPIADLFTYFDCTDYVDGDKQNKTKKGIVSFASRKYALNFWWDYIMLSLAEVVHIRSTHGGYFDGNFSQELMYNFTFLGFKKYIAQGNLDNLEQKCKTQQIQVILAPERFDVDILGKQRDRSGY